MAGKWLTIESAPSGRKVLAGYPNVLGNWRTVTARKVERFTEEAGEEGGIDEYNEADDTYYWVAGWYEVNHEQGESWLIRRTGCRCLSLRRAPPSPFPRRMRRCEMAAYYNECDPYAAQWLRNLIAAGLIPDGEVDERSIVDVAPSDLAGFNQCHFFAGIGGWSEALRIAGWPDGREVWTGSCPCQPWSRAGRSEGADSGKHLWPVWLRLIADRKPRTVFGEQVPTAAGRGWWDEVAADLEGIGYAWDAAIAPASGVGATHKRERLWFVAHSVGERDGLAEREIQAGRDFSKHSAWWDSEPGVGRVAHGVPSRVGRLRAYGNAIVPQLGAAVIRAHLETCP